MPDYYGDPEEAAPSGAQGPAKSDAEPKDDEGGETALIPKSLLAGKEFKPGEEVVFKIEHLFENEVEISYAKDDKSKPEPSKSQMDQSTDALDKFAKPPA